MKIFKFKTSLAVEDYYPEDEENGDGEIAFEDAADDIEGAIRDAKKEIKDIMLINRLPRGLEILAEFLEFDSSNIADANAYFNINVLGPDIFIDELKKRYKEKWD